MDRLPDMTKTSDEIGVKLQSNKILGVDIHVYILCGHTESGHKYFLGFTSIILSPYSSNKISVKITSL